MRYRKTPAANAARRRGRRYRLASAFPRRRYLPAADVSFLSSSSVSPPLLHYPRLLSSHVLTYPAPSPLPPSLFFSCLHPSPSRKSPSRLLFSPLYTLSLRWICVCIYISISLTRVRPPLVHSRLLFIPLRSPLSSVAIHRLFPSSSRATLSPPIPRSSSSSSFSTTCSPPSPSTLFHPTR